MAAPMTIIVIGVLVGGVDAIRTIVAALSTTLDAAVFVAMHIGSHKSDLPWLLDRLGTMSASHATQGEQIRTGHILVAPPDRHATINSGKVILTKGQRKNLARPAIDPMFRSAARIYGADVIGVVLTDGLNDETAGLKEVKAQGGIAIARDPLDAAGKSMPKSAIANGAVDHVLPVPEIAPCSPGSSLKDRRRSLKRTAITLQKILRGRV